MRHLFKTHCRIKTAENMPRRVFDPVDMAFVENGGVLSTFNGGVVGRYSVS
jgi:hypothetical protein